MRRPDLRRCNAAAPPPTTPSGFVPLVLQRVLDTRTPTKAAWMPAQAGPCRSTSARSPANAADRLQRDCDRQLRCRLHQGVFSARRHIEHRLRGRPNDCGLVITPMTAGKACIFASNPTDARRRVMGASRLVAIVHRWHQLDGSTRGGGSAHRDHRCSLDKMQTQLAVRAGRRAKDATAVWLT